MRQLLTRNRKQLLPHELCHPERVGHIGDHVVRIELRAEREASAKVLDQRLDAVAGAAADREPGVGLEL